MNVDSKKIKEMIKRLDGISYHEWKKLAHILGCTTDELLEPIEI